MVSEGLFVELLEHGLPRSAIELALCDLEASGFRDPGRCVIRIHRVVAALDARGAAAGLPELRSRIERAFERARLPVPQATESLWQVREPEIGAALFPVVWGEEGTRGALRWIRIQPVSSVARHPPTRPATLEALATASRLVASLFPDFGSVVSSDRVRAVIEPDLPSNAHLDGDSLAAAAFVAFASYALRRPIAPTHVLTGALGPQGDLRPVDPFTLAAKRAALSELPQATFLVAPGHPSVTEGSTLQIGQLSRTTELLTLVLGPWWSAIDAGRSVWIDRSWREALRIESWWLDLFEQHAVVETIGEGRAVDARAWTVLGRQLRDAIDAWQEHFVRGIREEVGGATHEEPADDDAMEHLGPPPSIGRGKTLDLIGTVRMLARQVVLRRRATLESWLTQSRAR